MIGFDAGRRAEPANALFRRFPSLMGRLPHVALGRFPTPLERLNVGGNELWIKRDELTGERYGGNKVRKLEFVLGAARAAGAKRVVTAGATGSHHALATAIYGAAQGLEVTLLLFPQEVTPHSREVLLAAHAAGAEIRPVPAMGLVPAALRLAALRGRGRVYVIPPGGSEPAGVLGFVSAALELAEQLSAGQAPVPADIHLAASTLGSTAGLAIGLSLAGLPSRIVAHGVVGALVTNRFALRRLIARTRVLLGAHGVQVDLPKVVAARVHLTRAQLGGGYGRTTVAGAAAARTFQEAGVLLDPTYTAKAGAGLLEAARAASGPQLFWHTLSRAIPPSPPASEPLPPGVVALLRYRGERP